jgi:predicted AlkP superfamily phosphohydrolase/phosphomutase
MESSIPEVSSVSWSSIITGRNPGEHGIYGFTEIIPNTYTISFPNSKNLRSPPFWQINNKRSVIINVPSTYPAQKINGFIVTGFISLDLQKSVYPKEYIDTLNNMNYKIDVDSKKAHKSTQLFFKDLLSTLEKRIELYQYLWDKIKWDTFMLVFTGTDRLEHFLWNAYEEKNHEFHQQFLKYFQKIDEVIGDINKKLKDSDSLIMLSDHGMGKIKTDINLNTLLSENDFLKLANNPNRGYNNINEGTKAFAMEPARIYINKKGKYPKGEVKKSEEEEIITELIDLFSKLKYKDEKVIRKIWKKQEIYHGQFIENAPDLVLLPYNGYSLRGSIKEKPLFYKDNIINGMHTQQNAFLFIKNKDKTDVIPKNPNVEHIITIKNRLSG